jgi:uncharacterized protein
MKLSKETIIKRLSESSTEIKERFDVKQIGIFGSYAENNVGVMSDLDILVEFNKNTFDNYMDLKTFLEGLFDCDVDLVIKENLKPRLKTKILEKVIYAEGL